MRKFKFYATSLIILSVLFMGFSSCKKTCEIEGDSVDSGLIKTDVLVYPVSGYITQDMDEEYHVHAGSGVASKFEMSTNGGQSKSPFNYSQYSILAYPMVLNCNFYMEREVRVDDVNMTATYKIKVTQCKDPKCEEKRFVENFVSVPAIPESYTILHDIEIIEQ